VSATAAWQSLDAGAGIAPVVVHGGGA
jgi:hypothetical protein